MTQTNKILKKINELYILKRKKFLLMTKKGDYVTINYDGQKRNILADWRIEEHLAGKTTLGVFPGSEFTKFICFDVDVKDENISKWVVYKLVNTLIEMGIPDQYIIISLSGSKGYHVEIFFDKPVFNKDINKFYLMVLNKAELLNLDYGQVELRPTHEYGVKIPLGKHMKTGKTCWYCDYDNRLNPITKYEYILTIQQMDSQFFYELLNEDSFEAEEKIIEQFELSRENVKSLDIYKHNVDEQATIEAIEALIDNGLTIPGTRHKSLFNIARYYRYLRLSQEESKELLKSWMESQDTRTYTTKWEDVVKDIELITRDVYEKNYSLTLKKNGIIDISKAELAEILKIKGKNEKLLLYVMLIHSKRYSNKDCVFFITYEQMSELTGISSRTTLIKLIKTLEELNYLEVYRSDKTIYNAKLNKPVNEPNKYKINLLCSVLYKNENESKFQVCEKNCPQCFNACLCNIYEEKELRQMLPRRQFDNVIEFTNYCIKDIKIG